MKTLSKVLCLLMVAVMCMSFFGASASALSFNIGGSDSSNSGISFPIGVSGDEEAEATPTPTPSATPALDAGFGAGEPDEGYSPEVEDDDEDYSNAVDKMAEALKNGQRTIKFSGYFCFDKELVIEKDMDVSLVLTAGCEVEDTDKIIVNGTARISGTGSMGALPTVNEGGKLFISGGSFTEDPSKYLAEGYKVDTSSGYFDVVKDTAAADEPKDEDEPEDEEIAIYRDIDDASKKVITLTPNGYYKGSGVQVTAQYNSDEAAAGNLEFFFLVSTSADTVNSEDVLTADVDYYVDHAADGTSTVYLKNSFLDKLNEGFYWFGGGKFSGSKVDLESVRYSDTTLHIAKQEVPSTGDGTGGILVSVYDKQYTANGGWESGDGHLYFVYTPGDYTVYKVTIDDLGHKVTLTLNNEQWYDQGGGYFYVGESQFLNQLSKGEHTITLYAKDGNGNVFTGSCNFLVLQDPAPTLEFSGTYKHVINSGKSLKLKSSEPIKAVYAGKNGTKLDNFDYTMYKLSNDGKTLTLTPEFLNARTAGYSYALWVEDTSGNESNVVYFQILTTAQANASVDTGDASDIALWTAFLILSGAAVAVALPRVKKNGGKE